MGNKQHQQPLNVSEQIENLKTLELKIENEIEAASFLNDVSYFRFIKAYSLDLKPRNGKYHEEISFNMLKELYLFNSNFRHLLFPKIEHIEVNLRCRLANYFCVKYGVLGYLDANNFANGEYHAEFLEDIALDISRNAKSPFVKNFQRNYEGGTIPFYALVELCSFGNLSKFLKNMKNEDKKEIGKIYGIGYTYLESWIESLAVVRNICAHYGRIYNFNLAKTPMMYKQYQDLERFKIFSILVCMKYLLANDLHWRDFVLTLETLIHKYPNVQISSMGFPENWKEYLLPEIIN